MSKILITSKLEKPELPSSYIEKSKVIEGLSSCKISLVCAQAGTGKSSAVSDWLNHQDKHYIWYNLDDWDNDLNQFLFYISQGLITFDKRIGEQFEQLTQGNFSLSEEGLIKGVISLLQNLSQPCTLVLDDYHNITQRKIHNLLNALLSHLPSKLSVCIISREDPPIHLGKLRSQQKLYELRMSSLKFDIEDADKLFKLSLLKPLTKDQTEYLYRRSEGWVAGIQLIAMTLQKTDDVEGFIKSFAGNHEYIMDYLLEEVLDKHLASTREFLLKTSIFTYFSHEMCAYVLEISNEVVVLETEHLLRTNSFLLMLNKDKHCYRYHHLFKALLKQQLPHYEGIDTMKLYKRAGKWFENHEDYQEAIKHYLEGRCYEDAQALIEKRYSIMDMALHSASWLELAKRLPTDYIESSPVICLGYGWALLDQGNIEDCQEWFVKSQNLYDLWCLKKSSKNIKIYDKEAFNNIPITLLCSKAYIAAIKGEYESLVTFTDELTRLALDHSYSHQWIVESFVGMMHWGQGNLKEALKIMMNLQESSSNDLNKSVQNAFTWIVAEIYIQKGELTRAKLLIEKAIEEVNENKVLPFLMATYYMLLSLIESIRGHKDQAYKHLETSKDYGYLYEFMDWRYKYNLLKSRLYIQDQLFDQAKDYIQEGKENTFLNPVPEVFTFEDMSFYLVMIRDKDQKKKNFLIEEAIKKIEESSLDSPNYIEEMHWKIILSQASIEDYGKILHPICQKLLKRARRQERYLNVVEYTLILRRYTNDKAEKEYLLNRAKDYSKKEGFVQPFLEFCQSKVIIDRDEETPFEIQRAKVNENLSEPLTVREIELLALIEKGYSNQEISDTLFITLSTVKSYNNKLFSKLEVKRRTEAVSKAKVIGLLK